MMSRIKDSLIPMAYKLANDGAIAMAQQDQFAKEYLDTEQGIKFLALCRRVRANAAPTGQRLLDECVAIIEANN